MTHHVNDHAIGVSDKEAANAPRLVRQWVNDAKAKRDGRHPPSWKEMALRPRSERKSGAAVRPTDRVGIRASFQDMNSHGSRTCLGLAQEVLDDHGQVKNRLSAITLERRPVHRRQGCWFQGGEPLQRGLNWIL